MNILRLAGLVRITFLPGGERRYAVRQETLSDTITDINKFLKEDHLSCHLREFSLLTRNRLKSLEEVFSTYADRLAAFQPNARLYLFSAVLTGASQGVFRLLFNFFVLSLGYDDALLGTLVAANSMTILICAVPLGYLADLLGRKSALLIGGVVTGLAVICMAIWPSVPMFYIMNIIMGAGQSLGSVTMGPFLIENSDDKERTYLFSFASGLQTGSAFIGNWIGGILPTWLNGWDLRCAHLLHGLRLFPADHWGRLSDRHPAHGLYTNETPVTRAAFGLCTILIFPQPSGAVGEIDPAHAGDLDRRGDDHALHERLFRQTYGLSDPAIGTMFAWGSLADGHRLAHRACPGRPVR